MLAHTSHNHQTCINTALINAGEICAAKNVRFTPLRKRVLELLWGNHKTVKAYDILEILHREDKSAKPPTVYRTLEFLLEVGLIHKVDSLNAYVGCSHPQETPHSCQFMICRSCGVVTEFCDPDIFNAINVNARALNFSAERQIIEVHGVCKECSEHP